MWEGYFEQRAQPRQRHGDRKASGVVEGGPWVHGGPTWMWTSLRPTGVGGAFGVTFNQRSVFLKHDFPVAFLRAHISALKCVEGE